MSRCRGCFAPVEWIVTPNGKRMPVDPTRVSVVLVDGGPLRVVMDEESVLARTSHFATCPEADSFRKGRS